MFRYFYRIWDRFKYKYNDKSEIVAAAIYTYKGERGKDERYVYKLPQLEEDILVYNFRTIDVEKIELNNIDEENPLKLVFTMAKKLLETGSSDEEIYKAKIELAKQLKNYDKVKSNEQIKALVDFLEYLFLIQDEELENKYKEFKKLQGGAFKMTIDEIRKMHYTQKGIEEGRDEGIKEEKINIAKKLLLIGMELENISKATGLSIEEIESLRH